MSFLNYALLASALVSIGAAAFCFETKKSPVVPLVSTFLTGLFLLVSIVSASAPVNNRPVPPFILYAASGGYAWAGSPEGAPPRTYVWRVPNEMQEALQGGALLVEEGQAGEEENESFPYGEWTVSPVEKGVEK